METLIKRYHGCSLRNRDGTNKIISKGYQCSWPTNKLVSRPTKLKYLKGRVYRTRYGQRSFTKEIRERYLHLVRTNIYNALREVYGDDAVIMHHITEIDSSKMNKDNAHWELRSKTGSYKELKNVPEGTVYCSR